MSNAHEAREVGNAGAVVEDFGSETIALALVDATIAGTGGNTASVLTTVLQVVESLVDLSGSVE